MPGGVGGGGAGNGNGTTSSNCVMNVVLSEILYFGNKKCVLS